AVRKIRELIDAAALGDLYYYDSQRVNLGLFQHDVNVIWDLAPHDLSIMEHLIDEEPEAIMAAGERHVNGHEDMAYITVFFPHRIIAHLNVNWLSPVKVRTTLIGGEKKMLVWNDLEADEKVKVYDKGVVMNGAEGVHKLLVSYRSGDMWAPKIEQTEALREELSYFYDCIVHNKRPINNGISGWRVVRMIEAACRSMKTRGEVILLNSTGTRTGMMRAA
ncbi:MAG: Gfo/Idh/MocA family oxidoreductase, partial [Candidatus Korobacteraceae bacterium]